MKGSENVLDELILDSFKSKAKELDITLEQLLLFEILKKMDCPTVVYDN